MTAILSVFPDTNLFLQCKPLQELDWTLLGHHGDIEVLITRPVQTELDAFKGKGNSRQAGKSRAATSLISKLLDAPEAGFVLRQNPTVRLRMARAMRPDPTAADELNYEFRDDQLVGIALAFHKANSDASAVLLTYDNGPMFSAREVRLPYKKIPDEWMLLPEPDEAARRESALKSELERYKKNEPCFEIVTPEVRGQTLELSCTTYTQLTEEEVASTLPAVFLKFPEATYFGPSEPSESLVRRDALSVALFGEEKEVFTPASAEAIERYKRSYTEWKESCKSYLKHIHNELNKHLDWPSLTIRISNIGSRPADDALVELGAKGHICIARPRRRNNGEGDDEPKSDTLPKFPPPPIAPSGWRKRIRRTSLFDFPGLSGELATSLAEKHYFDTAPILHNLPTSRDPNGFYWKDTAQEVPLTYLSLECDQWRHAREPENFTASLRFRREAGVHSGSLTVKVHAANLTNPTSKSIAVRVNIVAISPISEVERQIKEL